VATIVGCDEEVSSDDDDDDDSVLGGCNGEPAHGMTKRRKSPLKKRRKRPVKARSINSLM
jgi:hypothetical protein